MTVGTFVQPDFEAQSGTAYKTNLDNAAAVHHRLSGSYAPHEQDTPDMTVRVDAGALWVSGALVESAAQDSAIITAPAVDPRIDRIVIDSETGVVSVITGVEDDPPAAPAITAGKLPVCQVLLAASTTEITNDLITDERVAAISSSSSLELASDSEAKAWVVDTKAVSPSQLRYAVPAGVIMGYGGSSAPTGYLMCDGSLVSRTTYADLFAVIGTTFGAGDGSTTFKLPDMQQRVPMGKAASGTGHTLGETGGTIDHTHLLALSSGSGNNGMYVAALEGELPVKQKASWVFDQVFRYTDADNQKYLVLNFIIRH